MNGSDLYGYIKFMIQSGPHMGCRSSSLGCKEFWPGTHRNKFVKKSLHTGTKYIAVDLTASEDFLSFFPI